MVAVLSAAGFLVFLMILLGPLAWWLAGDTVEALRGKERSDAINGVRQLLLQATAGGIAATALVFTARTYVLSREGHVTDRYTKAIDQLGAETLDQRIGGIYALERIMRDSSKDHAAVVDVLAAFVRVHGRRAGPGQSMAEGEELAAPGADIQAALSVLGRRPLRTDREPSPIRLSDADLRRTLLRGGRLECVRLRRAHLEGVRWEGADLQGARMRGAHLHKADLAGADLRHASLERTDLRKVKLTDARLDHANLVGAQLAGAKLTGASLQDVHLAGTHGEFELSEQQREQAHCLPTEEACDAAQAATRQGPCSRFEW